MVKIIFFDIDGTLLAKKQKHISEEVIQALYHLKQQGILLCIATGRHMEEIKQLHVCDDFAFDQYITLNGCYCITDQHKCIYKAPINKQDVINITAALNTIEAAYTVVTKHGSFLNKVDKHTLAAYKELQTPMPTLASLDNIIDEEILQIIPYLSKEQLDTVIPSIGSCQITQWHPFGYDILSCQGGKEAGIDKVLEYYNIDPSHTMAFGDGLNDVGMLKKVKIGICMGNGKEETKKVSSYVTKNVDKNGIVHALKHYEMLIGEEIH